MGRQLGGGSSSSSGGCVGIQENSTDFLTKTDEDSWKIGTNIMSLQDKTPTQVMADYQTFLTQTELLDYIKTNKYPQWNYTELETLLNSWRFFEGYDKKLIIVNTDPRFIYNIEIQAYDPNSRYIVYIGTKMGTKTYGLVFPIQPSDSYDRLINVKDIYLKSKADSSMKTFWVSQTVLNKLGTLYKDIKKGLLSSDIVNSINSTTGLGVYLNPTTNKLEVSKKELEVKQFYYLIDVDDITRYKHTLGGLYYIPIVDNHEVNTYLKAGNTGSIANYGRNPIVSIKATMSSSEPKIDFEEHFCGIVKSAYVDSGWNVGYATGCDQETKLDVTNTYHCHWWIGGNGGSTTLPLFICMNSKCLYENLTRKELSIVDLPAKNLYGSVTITIIR